ncbi:hypothetical protein HBZS_117640 [Helicobacter bizzozeronii CCUG 35545]|nr:hypothetical protein HBZS_117640 [Helicobacter bizzozeronii CCUG 35545]
MKDPAEIPSFEPEKTPKWYFILPLVALAILSVGIYTYYKTSKTFSPQTHTQITQENPETTPTLEEAPPHASTQTPPNPHPPQPPRPQLSLR